MLDRGTINNYYNVFKFDIYYDNIVCNELTF